MAIKVQQAADVDLDFEHYLATDPLKDVRLTHGIESEFLEKRFFSTLLRGGLFRIVSPADTGLDPAQLEEYFQQDMKRKAKPFRHRQLYPSRGHLFSGMPLYSGLGMSGVFDNQTGVRVSEDGAGEYCLIVQEDDGGIAGFVEARFSLITARAAQDIADADELGVLLTVTLRRAYTCARYRGTGAFSFAANVLEDAYLAELKCINSQVAAVSAEAGRRVDVETTVYAELESRSGYLAAHRLSDYLESGAEMFAQLGEAPQLNVLPLVRDIGF